MPTMPTPDAVTRASPRELTVPQIDHRSPLPSLTGLRWVAAAPVFFFHLSLTSIHLNPFRDPDLAGTYETALSKAGWVGVSFFFVLSGFLLTWRHSESRGPRPFVRKRLTKIFSLHLLTWTIAMVLYAGAMATSPAQYLPNLFLVNSWVPIHDVYLSVNIPSWSLCCEFLFYLLFPVLVPLVRRIPIDRLWWALAACVGGTLVVASINSFLPSTPTVDGLPISSLQFWVGYNFPVPRLFEFGAGMVLARLLVLGKVPAIRSWMAWTAALIGYLLASVVPFTFSFIPVMLVPLLMLISAAVRRDLDGERSWLASRTMTWLGEISFGFYMAQQIVLYTVRTTFQHNDTYAALPALATMAIIFTLTVLAGWLLYRWVEVPAMDRLSVRRPRPRPEGTVTRETDRTGALT